MAQSNLQIDYCSFELMGAPFARALRFQFRMKL